MLTECSGAGGREAKRTRNERENEMDGMDILLARDGGMNHVVL